MPKENTPYVTGGTMFRCGMILLLFSLFIVDINQINAGERDTYYVDCPEDFPGCEKSIIPELEKAFRQQYPPAEWKIIVPKARFFLLGNGTLKGYLSIALVPASDPVSTKELNAYNSQAHEPKKQFSVEKRWGDIIAMGGEFSDVKRFGPFADERVYRAKEKVYKKMAAEAAMKMNRECLQSDVCNSYEQE